MPPPQYQQQYVNMTAGNDNVPAGPPSNSQSSASGFQKAKSFGKDGVQINAVNEMAMLDQMKPRPPPGMPQRNGQNQRSNSSLGQKPNMVP